MRKTFRAGPLSSFATLFCLLCTFRMGQAQKPETGLVAPLRTPWTFAAETATVPWSDYPSPQMTRERWLDPNDRWDYMGGASVPNTLEAGVTSPVFSANPETIRVPFPPESLLSGILRRQELNMRYRRSFTLPAKWKAQRTLLHFGPLPAVPRYS